jgi:hypothetical protein
LTAPPTEAHQPATASTRLHHPTSTAPETLTPPPRRCRQRHEHRGRQQHRHHPHRHPRPTTRHPNPHDITPEPLRRHPGARQRMNGGNVHPSQEIASSMSAIFSCTSMSNVLPVGHLFMHG